MVETIGLQMDALLSSSLSLPCEISHYTVVILSVKQQWNVEKARDQPFATWFFSLLCCFGGGCLVNFCVGNPVLTPLANTQSVALASLVWWLVFYCPKSMFSSFMLWTPINLTISLLKEMIRTRKIIKSVKLAIGVYPSSFLLCTVIGMFGACGGGVLKNLGGLINSTWNQSSIKIFSFATITKLCLFFSALYTLQLSGYIETPITTLALYQSSIIYAIVLTSKFGIIFDPFALLEKIAFAIFVDVSLFDETAVENVGKKDDKKNKENSKKVK